MTRFRPTPPVPAPTLASAEAALRAGGLCVSVARRVVLEALFAAGGPVSAERIAAGIEGRVPRSDLASVYRNLETLDRLGLVRHFHLGHGPGLYVLSRDIEREYLVCEDCGSLEEVEAGALELVRAAVRTSFGYEAHFGHFPIVGSCPRCASASAHQPTDVA